MPVGKHDLSKLLFWCTVILFITEIMAPLILYEMLSKQFKTGCCRRIYRLEIVCLK